MLIKDDEIKEGWRRYFCKFNVDHESNIALEANNSKASNRIRYVRNIRVSKIKDALRRMKIGKGVGPNSIIV